MMANNFKLSVSHIVQKSDVNGPESRIVVWLAPCYRGCVGCFNTGENLKINTNQITVDDILSYVDDGIKGISISGGEPFYQDDSLCKLLIESKKKNLNTLIYSGYTYNEIISRKFKAIKFCDYLIDGRYIPNFVSACKYSGSGNQRLLLLNDGRIVDDLTLKYSDDFNKFAEIFITPENIISTGLLDVL